MTWRKECKSSYHHDDDYYSSYYFYRFSKRFYCSLVIQCFDINDWQIDRMQHIII